MRGFFVVTGSGPLWPIFYVMRNIPVELQTMVAGVVDTFGYQLWGIEWVPGKPGQLLRIYIDKVGGVHLDDCALVSRQLSALLDVEDPIAGEYVLEVSSPGMDRPIFTLDQLAALCGSRIRLKLKSAIAGRKNYRGDLSSVQGGQIRLLVEGEPVELAFADVDSAHLVPEF